MLPIDEAIERAERKEVERAFAFVAHEDRLRQFRRRFEMWRCIEGTALRASYLFLGVAWSDQRALIATALCALVVIFSPVREWRDAVEEERKRGPW